ncbi:MAG: tetratricopeptide repeat protein [Candidatus Margulisbacteria bacterium]|nr:tetratricopeptide repeat protein [Candidatus Margulisiibacteriota bacterium]
MLKFFREKASFIVWSIVIAFGVTMFVGAVFFGNSFSKKSTPQDLSKMVAMAGNLAVSQAHYYQNLSVILEQFRQERPYENLTPDYLEVFQWNSFLRALQFEVLLEGAKKADISVSRSERSQLLDSVYLQLKLSGKKELKALLASRNITYNTFLENQENEYMVQKFSKKLQDGLSVSDEDVDKKYTELKVRHLIVRVTSPTMDATAKAKALDITQKITKGLSFQEAARFYSDDLSTKASGGDLGWVAGGSTEISLDNVLFSLKNGQVSEPIQTSLGYEIVQVLDRRDRPRPLDLDYGKEKESILAAKRGYVLQSYVQTFLNQNLLKVLDVTLRAYQAKMKGDIQEAVAAYQAQISQSPTSPIPHYMLAKVYMAAGDEKKALEELKRAEVKGELLPSVDLSVVHLTLVDLYKKNGESALVDAEYDRAIKTAELDIVSLNTLKKLFEKSKDGARLHQVQAAIGRFNAKVSDLKRSQLSKKL